MKPTVDTKLGSVANAMDMAASSLRGRSGVKAQVAANAIESAARYVREHDIGSMVTDVTRGVKRHPGATLMAAAAAGFLLARTLSRHPRH